jgi:predicted dehydrogenase
LVVDKVRWGVLSTARIATEKVIPGIRRSERGEVVAIGSRGDDRARAAAARLGIQRSHGSYEALLADPDVDAIYVPLPNHLHAEWSIKALRAGKHVLCEKPMALSVAEAEAMAAAASDSGRLLVEAFMYRHHPSWILVRELIAAGRIGTLSAVDSWFSYFNPDPANIRNVLEWGGGGLWDIGCYSVNLSRMLFDSEPAAVSAALVRDPVSGVDVLATGTMAFPAGVASFTCATLLEPDQRVHVYGSDGRIDIEIPFNIPPLLATRVFLTTGRNAPEAQATETFELPPADQYARQADAFAATILDGAPSPLPLADTIANTRVIERLFLAGES